MNLLTWPNFIPPSNSLVREVIERLLSKGDFGADDKIPDSFCESWYCILASKDKPCSIFVSYKLWSGFKRGAAVSEGVSSILKLCKGVADRATTLDGYDLTLVLDAVALSKHEQKDSILEAIASAYLYIVGYPLRNCFELVAEGKSPDEPLKEIATSSTDTFYVKEGYGAPDAVAVIFPIRLKRHEEGTLALAFVQEMAASRAGAPGSAPQCHFSPARQPPPELEGVPLGTEPPVGGFVTFVLRRRHLEGPRLEPAVWAMLSFPALVSYHAKAAHLSMRLAMRKKAEEMLKALNRARREGGRMPLKGSDGPKGSRASR